MADFDNEPQPEDYVYDPNNPPSPQQILAMLDSLTGLSDEDREQIKSELLHKQTTEDYVHVPPQTAFNSQMLMLITMLVFVSLIFVFFGYKLYKSLTEKERKRDEKKKMKQQKKKK